MIPDAPPGQQAPQCVGDTVGIDGGLSQLPGQNLYFAENVKFRGRLVSIR